MTVIPFRIYLEQPVLIAQPSGDPNSVESLDYIPGSLLRGVLIGRYLRQIGADPQSYDLAGDATARQLFFDGGARVLNAYLLSGTQQRSLPTPLAMLQLKSADTESGYVVYNAAHEEWDDAARREAEGEDQLKPLGQPYCTISDDDLAAYSVAPGRIAVHVQRDRALGRATTGSGTIFQYESLAEGQTFAGALLLDSPDDEAILCDLLRQKEAWLGRSRSAGYGRVRIEVGRLKTMWREVGEAAIEDVAPDQPLMITLLSDALLRDSSGVPVASLAQQPLVGDHIDDAILSAYLGFAVRIDPARSFSAATLAGGFNQTWRLPLPQQPALKAGSMFFVRPAAPVSAETLRRLEQRGIGERRAEGYGRMAFQWLGETQYRVRNAEAFNQQAEPPALSTTGRSAAQRMALRLLEQQIDLHLNKRVRELSNEAGGLPRNSQLGRIRALSREASQRGDLSVISGGIAQFKGDALRQLERARLGARSLSEWLQDVTQPDQVWAELSLTPATWPQVAGMRAEPGRELSTRTSLRLIDAVLTGLHRRQRQKEEERQA